MALSLFLSGPDADFHDVAAPAFLNDCVRLALTCRSLHAAGAWSLSLYNYWEVQWQEFRLDNFITCLAAEDECYPVGDIICESCGRYPAVEWLGYSECSSCYDEH